MSGIKLFKNSSAPGTFLSLAIEVYPIASIILFFPSAFAKERFARD